MYVEFRGGPLDGVRFFFTVPTETIVHVSDNHIGYHYRKTSRISQHYIVFQYLEVLEPELCSA